ncbi:MAG: protein-L-isoaspartate(D-aspartate) O-methyltransferase [Calditrichia bacterium]|nr:protein-L-isoaspartate(D-aspartate) O-methyltransferase [Calditrichota bacterium]MCB0266922.1 protein-L-isoaspartate(D-aspartate) O-methyltransferase [Calditrichota bacterium]MCB0287677.1 protein-L-isoaspartate(D-aspartate) O-methyltransferase [Calditrichota bacterium]MCB9066854.1 protein-L-isoaspartate(D-aspartate) O-methyltransferase [Calditrichia bacterium]
MTSPETGGNREQLWQKLRRQMVDEHLMKRGISDARVLQAFLDVPRHLFVPEERIDESYDDKPLPIGWDQTISQPFIVAYMVGLLSLKQSERVLEIGTGSGYETAILAKIISEVYSIEIVPELSERADKIMENMGLANVRLRVGNGYEGWPEAAPFDAIIVSAAPKKIPHDLIHQLRIGGRMIIPVGGMMQRLFLITRGEKKLNISRKIPVRFVPMVR